MARRAGRSSASGGELSWRSSKTRPAEGLDLAGHLWRQLQLGFHFAPLPRLASPPPLPGRKPVGAAARPPGSGDRWQPYATYRGGPTAGEFAASDWPVGLLAKNNRHNIRRD